MAFKENLVMRTVLAVIATVFLTTIAISLSASAQQPVRPMAPQQAEPHATPEVKEKVRPKRRELAQHRRMRHASLRRYDTGCAFINGWRAFPLHDPLRYFNTDRKYCR
jgi:hypothetical protein